MSQSSKEYDVFSEATGSCNPIKSVGSDAVDAPPLSLRERGATAYSSVRPSGTLVNWLSALLGLAIETHPRCYQAPPVGTCQDFGLAPG